MDHVKALSAKLGNQSSKKQTKQANYLLQMDLELSLCKKQQQQNQNKTLPW